MKFNRLDIAQAHYLFGVMWRDDKHPQYAENMNRAIKLLLRHKTVTPPTFGYPDLSDNGKKIYRHIQSQLVEFN